MSEYALKTTDAKPYMYVTRKCAVKPEAVGVAMGKAYADVMGFIQSHNICIAGPALSVYYTYDPDEVEFRAGFFISEKDMTKAEGDVEADKTPTMKALTFKHIGSYSKLRETYNDMMAYAKEQGLELDVPTWEVYVTDPDSTPEAELQTAIFMGVSSVVR